MLQGDRNVTYVSRMQGVQAAIENQIEEMARTNPDRKIGLVTFNNEVKSIGDGTKAPITITGDKLSNKELLIQLGEQESSKVLQQPIKDTKQKLVQEVMQIEETGPTALGPALTTSISLASQGAPGSTVILCTDGLANVGLGAFDEIKTEEEGKKVDEFYEILG